MCMANLNGGLDLAHGGRLHKESDHARCDRPWLIKDPENAHTLIELQDIGL